MQRLDRATSLVLLAGLGLSLVACGQVNKLKARKAFKEANTLYQQQEYKKAADKYLETVTDDPNFTAAYFYLANSYDNLYKPSRKGEAANDAFLAKAVEYYKKASDVETDALIRKRSFEFLVAAYGPDKLNDPAQQEPLLQRMIQIDPQDPANYFALAKTYEDAGQYEQAEGTLIKARESRPNDPTVYLQIAGYYNRQGEFDKTIDALQQRAAKEPNNPEAYYTISTYYWDKAYRDTKLKEPEKKDMVQKGIEQVDKALQIKPDYMEALVYKNLLLRLEANLEKDPAKQQALIKQADQLRDRATELKKKKVAGVGD